MRRNTYMVYQGSCEGQEGSGEALANCVGGCGSPIFTGGLIENMGQMMGNGFFAQDKLLGDFGIGKASGDQSQDFYFPRGQSRGVGCR